jgi:PRTRC genetic system protein B
MEIQIDTNRQLVAQHALIIYGYEKESRYDEPANSIDHYITKHRVDGERRLLEGVPLTRETLRKICSLVIPSLETMEYIPERVLAYSPGTAIFWWTPGAPRRIFFTKETGLRSGIYPVPATLFLVVHRTPHTWALATTVRPEPATPVYHSPFFNVYEGGTCCMGNIDLPRNTSPGDINDWERAFFDGACNGHIAPKVQGIDPYELWRGIEGKSKFPNEYLVPCGTVEDVIKSAMERRAPWTQI